VLQKILESAVLHEANDNSAGFIKLLIMHPHKTSTKSKQQNIQTKHKTQNKRKSP
jgi:hypothetical protein